jgi:microcystin-dependent protein
MSDPYVGEIRIFAGNFAPMGWALCQGQTLPINTNTALFSLLGTTYGGNGTTTFNLPNLAGRCNLPSHAHPYSPTVNNANATVNDPTGAIPAVVNAGTGRNPAEYPAYTKNTSTGTAAAQMTGVTGQGIPVSNMQPFLVINYIIALVGIFPSRG